MYDVVFADGADDAIRSKRDGHLACAPTRDSQNVDPVKGLAGWQSIGNAASGDVMVQGEHRDALAVVDLGFGKVVNVSLSAASEGRVTTTDVKDPNPSGTLEGGSADAPGCVHNEIIPT